MYCRVCGSQVNEKSEICLKCGCKPLNGTDYCQNCGTKTRAEQVICVRCKAELKTLNSRKKMTSYGTVETTEKLLQMNKEALVSYRKATKIFKWAWLITLAIAFIPFLIAVLTPKPDGIPDLDKDVAPYAETHRPQYIISIGPFESTHYDIPVSSEVQEYWDRNNMLLGVSGSFLILSIVPFFFFAIMDIGYRIIRGRIKRLEKELKKP